MSGLRLVPAATFNATVKLTVPGEDKPATPVFIFAHKSKRDLQAWMANGQGKPDPEFLGEVVRGWKVGPQDENGSPVPFSTEAFTALLDAYPASGSEIYQGYLAAYHEAKAGN